MGVHFHECNPMMLAMDFEGCNLDLSTFCNLKLKNTKFRDTHCVEVDFTGADLSGSVFDNCDLDRAVFSGTNLEQADLRTSFNFDIDPENNRLKKAKFVIAGLAGLLRKYSIDIE
jgi:uncharacterized protein YjbI with pentapeptide repeats